MVQRSVGIRAAYIQDTALVLRLPEVPINELNSETPSSGKSQARQTTEGELEQSEPFKTPFKPPIGKKSLVTSRWLERGRDTLKRPQVPTPGRESGSAARGESLHQSPALGFCFSLFKQHPLRGNFHLKAKSRNTAYHS